MLTRRLQVLIEPAQYERLERVASRKGVSIGELVRGGIDMVCGTDPEARTRAADRFLSGAFLVLPDDPAELEAELDAMFDGPA